MLVYRTAAPGSASHDSLGWVALLAASSLPSRNKDKRVACKVMDRVAQFPGI